MGVHTRRKESLPYSLSKEERVMAIEVGDLFWIAIFNGIGTGLSVPIGNAIYKRFVQPHGKKVDDMIKEVGVFYGLKKVEDERNNKEM